MHGTLDIKGLEATTVSSNSIHTQATLLLFKKLAERYPFTQRIVVICDYAAYYRSKIVADDLKISRIESTFLPPYSPDFHLIEPLWQCINKKNRHHRYYETFLAFKRALDIFFTNISKYREELHPLLSRITLLS